jgi:hypothetical protein
MMKLVVKPYISAAKKITITIKKSTKPKEK